MSLGARLRASPLLATLAEPDFGRYAAGNVVSLIGTWMQRVAAGWLAWDLTGSGFWVGLVALAYLAPGLIVAPPAGVLADRRDRLGIIRGCQLVAAGQAGLLAALAGAGSLSPAGLTALVMVAGIIEAIHQPARLAIMPALVPRERLANAIAVNSVSFNTAHFLGPALAGAAMLAAGPALAFSANMISFLVFWWLLRGLRDVAAQPAGDGSAPGSVAAQIRESLVYVARDPVLTPAFLLFTVVALGLRPLVDLMPALVERVFAGGPAELAWLTSMVGLGAVGAGLWRSNQGHRALRDHLRVAAIAIALMGAALTAVLVPGWLAVALPAMAVYGMALAMGGIAAQTLVQQVVADHVRGRVLSLYGLLFRGSPAAGALAMGAAGDVVGPRLPVVVGAAAALAGAGVLVPRLGAAIAAHRSVSEAP